MLYTRTLPLRLSFIEPIHEKSLHNFFKNVWKILFFKMNQLVYLFYYFSFNPNSSNNVISCNIQIRTYFLVLVSERVAYCLQCNVVYDKSTLNYGNKQLFCGLRLWNGILYYPVLISFVEKTIVTSHISYMMFNLIHGKTTYFNNNLY